MKTNKKFLFWALFVLFLLFELIVGKQGLYNLWELRKEKILYTKKLNSLKEKNEGLMKEVERLRNDPEYIEAVIKREMKMVRHNEIIIYFKD